MGKTLPIFYTNELITSFESFLEEVRPVDSPKKDDLAEVPDYPLSQEIRGYKSTPVYLAHSYPTKVPPEAIIPYIEHYTRPGQVILDPFCGSGMTGVAARITGRHVLLNDLSAGAVHLAYNHCTPCDPDGLIQAFQEIATQCEGEFRWLYGTRCDSCNGPARIIYTLWSDVFTCVQCSKPLVLWDLGVDKKLGRVAEEIRCPRCRKKNRKRLLRRYSGAVPVLTNYECLGTCGTLRGEHKPTRAELRLIRDLSTTSIPYAHPDLNLDPNGEMYIRCALHLQRIKKVADFYTARNLRALGKVWREILLIPDRRIRAALAFAFTNTAWHATKMRRFNARGGQRPLTGTLYVPQLSIEANPLPVLRHKIHTLATFYRGFQSACENKDSGVAIRIGCATNLQDTNTNSIDYIFTDPPFGSNIFYADLNLIWESWLGQVTNPITEAVINRSKKDGKTLQDYQQLMKSSFSEMCRVLKPGRWASVVFHSTNDEVWRAVQTAAEESGFTLVHAGGIDKTKRSMRGYIGERNDEDIADGDVVLNLRKPKQTSVFHLSTPLPKNFEEVLVETIANHLSALTNSRQVARNGPQLDPRSLQYIHGMAVRAILNQGHLMEKVSFSFIRDLCVRHFRVQNRRVFGPRRISANTSRLLSTKR